MSAIRRSVAALSVASLAMGALSACSAGAPDPAPSADALVSAMNSGDFGGVQFAGFSPEDATKAQETAFGTMGEIKHESTVRSVAEDEEEQDGVKTATASITTVWDVDKSDKDLSYDTRAVWEFDKESDSWKLRFDPSILAPEFETGDYLKAAFDPAARGNITDAEGESIVSNRPVIRVGMDKTHAEKENWESSAKKLAKLVDIDEEAYVQRVMAAGDKAWVEAIVLRDDATREVTDEEIKGIPGANFHNDELPLAPTRSFARPLLGSVGKATAENIEKSEGKVKAGDQVGQSGLQAAYNDTLSGTAGVSVSQYNAEHEAVAELFTTAPAAGKDLKTTLDTGMQESADELLAEAESNSAIVVIRPSDGSVLAASSGPVSSGMNTSLQASYAPGSSFKVVSALAMLREGATPGTEVKCPATTVVDGKSFKNYDGYPASAVGTIPLSEAIAQSCNTVFVDQGKEIGGKNLADAAAALGLLAEDGTGAGAVFGSVPEDSEGTTQAANMIGQGVVEASPLGMATVMASIQAKSTVQPKLVLAPEPQAPAKPASTLSEEEAEQLSTMMAEVVDHGTLKDLKAVGSGKIIGKSGTAEYDSEKNAHAWAIAAQGDLAVAAFVEDGDGGAQSAGPLVKSMLEEAAK
ncbi:penicillin-binding transpeptidase domain-containing protein [Glutamicibacter sp.]|uniref:penicillin-binding transpeptidase domain-containing protein n=1 Tax=Glutamicibacter sp. TaxID=1931995 RepID=UPI003D6BF2CD